MGNQFRIPKTTAQFIWFLARILREELRFKITEHECWNFMHVADWKTYLTRYETAGNQEGWWKEVDFKLTRWMGAGHCMIDEGKLDIRLLITKTDWVALGFKDHFYYRFDLWIKHPDETISRHTFDCWNDGGDIIMNDENPPPTDPPRKIAFWRGNGM